MIGRSAALLPLLWIAAAPAAPVVVPDLPPQDEHAAYWVGTLKTHPLKLIRKNAARQLGKLGNKEAVPALCDALKDAFPGVQVEAAKALGLLGDERAFGPLHAVLNSSGDRELRRAANDAVEKIKAYQEFLKGKEAKLRAAEGAQAP
jgi:hypothetical protein